MAVTLPLWAGYLVKILSVRIVFSDGGFFNWVFGPVGISSPGYGVTVTIIALVYLWFPYMAIPLYVAVSQIPVNLFDASADLALAACARSGLSSCRCSSQPWSPARFHLLAQPR